MAAAKKIPEFQHAIESDADWSETIKAGYSFVEFHQSWAGPVSNTVRHYMQYICAQVLTKQYCIWSVLTVLSLACAFRGFLIPACTLTGACAFSVIAWNQCCIVSRLTKKKTSHFALLPPTRYLSIMQFIICLSFARTLLINQVWSARWNVPVYIRLSCLVCKVLAVPSTAPKRM